MADTSASNAARAADPAGAPDPALSWLATLLAGLAWGLAWPDVPGAALILLGAIVASQAVRGTPLTDTLRGFVCGLVWFSLQLAWFPEAWTRFAGGPAWVPVALVVLQAFGPALAFGLAGASNLARPLAIGLATCAASAISALWQPAPADLSLWLVGVPNLAWIAFLCGRAGLAGLTAAWGALAFDHPKRALPILAAALLLGAIPVADGPTIRVGIVQPGTGAFDGRRRSTLESRTDALVEQIRAVDADIVLTPEGASDRPLDLPENVLLGVSADTNSLISGTSRYDKHDLVPIGERRVLGIGQDRYVAGTGPRTITVGVLTVGPLICYEDTLPGAIAATQGDLLVAASNDTWLGPRGSALHLASSRLAAIETGTPVARPTTSGISALIDRRGRLLWTSTWTDGDRAVQPVSVVLPVQIGHPWWSGARANRPLAAIALLVLIGARLRPRSAAAAPATGASPPA